MENRLVNATWGLVVATGLLVIATLIPLISDILSRRDRRQRIAAQIVPGLNILKDRIRRTIEEMAKIAEPDEGLISGYIQICRRDLELLQPIIELRDFSLAVINELFILRHLLTFARDDLTIIGGDLKSGVPKSDRSIDEAWKRVRINYTATQRTIEKIEDRLPKSMHTVDGQDFRARISLVSKERQIAAAKDIATYGRETH